MQAQTMVFHITSNDILLKGTFVYSLRIAHILLTKMVDKKQP